MVTFPPSIVAHTTSLKYRPIYLAVCGSVECTALAFGPLISGTIAHYSTWRICFYLIIPIGVAVIVTIFFGIDPLRKTENAHLNRREKLERIDLIGFAISVPMSLCWVLGLQWAGTAYRWSNWRIILLLALAIVLLAIFLMAERRASEHGMIPLKMLRQRSVALASVITFSNFAALSIISYYVCCEWSLTQDARAADQSLVTFLLSSCVWCDYTGLRPEVFTFGRNDGHYRTCVRSYNELHRLL